MKIDQKLVIPSHIAIIMDGNGRWAEKHGKKRTFGHEKGAKIAEKVIEWSVQLGVKYLTLYSFSTENWKRPKQEVDFLFDLFIKYLYAKVKKIVSNDVKIRFNGRIDLLPEKLITACENIEEQSKNNSKLEVILAINYGGRKEILDAIQKIINNGNKEITEELFKKYLYLPDVPDPDLIIRTSGEKRLSNFLIWQSAYSEYYFTKVLWPDFSENDYLKAIKDYSIRKRKYGAIEEK